MQRFVARHETFAGLYASAADRLLGLRGGPPFGSKTHLVLASTAALQVLGTGHSLNPRTGAIRTRRYRPGAGRTHCITAVNNVLFIGMSYPLIHPNGCTSDGRIVKLLPIIISFFIGTSYHLIPPNGCTG